VIQLSRDSIVLGDTLGVSWQLPAGSKVVKGPAASDSLVVVPDSSRAGRWTLQPLSTASFGNDTLKAVSPTGDTLTDFVPSFYARPKVTGSDSSAASLLPPEKVPVPFPWDYVSIAGGSIAAVLLGIWGWKRYQAWKASRLPPPPPPPPRDPVEVAREKLEDLAKESRSGRPARETAFAVGELLRDVHGKLHGWTESVESTSFEWKTWCARNRPEVERIVVAEFLSEADLLRYADATHDAEALLAKALVLLDTQDRLRSEKP